MDLEQPLETVDSTGADSQPEDATQTETDLPEGLESQQPDPDEIEEEMEGVKLRGKKEALERIKAERLMQADYTRKTQEHAESRRAFEQERTTFQQSVQTQQALFKEVAAITAIDGRMQYLQQSLGQADPSTAQAMLVELNQLQLQRGQLVGSATQKHQHMQLATQRESVERANQAEQVVASVFKDWSPARYQALQEYAKSEGVSPQQLRDVLVNAPHFAKTLAKAIAHDQAAKQRQPAKQQPQPAARISGNNAANARPLSELTDPDEYIARRREWRSKNR